MTNYEQMAEQMYSAYCQQAGGLTFDGKPLPLFSELGLERQSCWKAVAEAMAPAKWLRVAPANLKQLADSFPELNPSNYGAEDVDNLHNWALEVVQAIITIGQEAESVVWPEPITHMNVSRGGFIATLQDEGPYVFPVYSQAQVRAMLEAQGVKL